MIKLAPLLKSFLVILPLTTILLGCDETETYHQTSNYFPMNTQTQWEYQWEYGCGCPEKYWPPLDSVVLKVTGDTLLNGKTYSKIENEYGVIKIVRQEGEKYFMVNLGDGTELLFLNTAVPVGGYWIVPQGDFWEHRFTMLKPIPIMTVNSITYYDVLVVKHLHSYDDRQFKYTTPTFHYYVNGIGEILTYNPPNPYSYMPYGSKFSLLKFK